MLSRCEQRKTRRRSRPTIEFRDSLEITQFLRFNSPDHARHPKATHDAKSCCGIEPGGVKELFRAPAQLSKTLPSATSTDDPRCGLGRLIRWCNRSTTTSRAFREAKGSLTAADWARRSDHRRKKHRPSLRNRPAHQATTLAARTSPNHHDKQGLSRSERQSHRGGLGAQKRPAMQQAPTEPPQPSRTPSDNACCANQSQTTTTSRAFREAKGSLTAADWARRSDRRRKKHRPSLRNRPAHQATTHAARTSPKPPRQAGPFAKRKAVSPRRTGRAEATIDARSTDRASATVPHTKRQRLLREPVPTTTTSRAFREAKGSLTAADWARRSDQRCNKHRPSLRNRPAHQATTLAARTSPKPPRQAGPFAKRKAVSPRRTGRAEATVDARSTDRASATVPHTKRQRMLREPVPNHHDKQGLSRSERQSHRGGLGAQKRPSTQEAPTEPPQPSRTPSDNACCANQSQTTTTSRAFREAKGSLTAADWARRSDRRRKKHRPSLRNRPAHQATTHAARTSPKNTSEPVPKGRWPRTLGEASVFNGPMFPKVRGLNHP